MDSVKPRIYVWVGLCKYWFMIAVPLELSMSLYLACTDVNLGIDESHSYPWISREGRQYLIYNLTDPAVLKKIAFCEHKVEI